MLVSVVIEKGLECSICCDHGLVTCHVACVSRVQSRKFCLGKELGQFIILSVYVTKVTRGGGHC